ncbi:MAG: NADH-quinone oxidoreductase subunit J [Acidobacteriota bacterium]
METILFFLLCAIAIGAAVNILVQRHPIYSALSLIVTLMSLAGIYIQMKAEFIAVMQIVVYAGAIMVLFVFVILLLNPAEEERASKRLWLVRYTSIPLALVLVWQVSRLVLHAFGGQGVRIDAMSVGLAGNTEQIGRLLYTQFALPLEVTSILLLVAILGAIVMAKKDA